MQLHINVPHFTVSNIKAKTQDDRTTEGVPLTAGYANKGGRAGIVTGYIRLLTNAARSETRSPRKRRRTSVRIDCELRNDGSHAQFLHLRVEKRTSCAAGVHYNFIKNRAKQKTPVNNKPTNFNNALKSIKINKNEKKTKMSKVQKTVNYSSMAGFTVY